MLHCIPNPHKTQVKTESSRLNNDAPISTPAPEDRDQSQMLYPTDSNSKTPFEQSTGGMVRS